jgi:hypothetical protein
MRRVHKFSKGAKAGLLNQLEAPDDMTTPSRGAAYICQHDQRLSDFLKQNSYR